ncbi:m7GpppX diphosphatase [Nematocida sp. ERTm5]|nr:m7GpppX diphosphatase [Nematocida sp. ERTm5]
MEKKDKLNRFVAESIINSQTGNISKVFLGKIDNEPAILTLNKVAFGQEFIHPEKNHLIHENDVYSSGTFENSEAVKYAIIHPATETQIKKYTASEHIMVKETPSMYADKVLPLALRSSPNCKWVDTIFSQSIGHSVPCITEGKEEVLFLDSEFLICPDLKWDRKTAESLYLLVLLKDPEIYTIRELRQEHIPLLERIQASIQKVLSTYEYRMDQVMVYFHYYPTFYRAHIHVSSVSSNWAGRSIGSSILLHDVIEGLKISSTFFKDKTMEICLAKGSYLYEAYSK